MGTGRNSQTRMEKQPFTTLEVGTPNCMTPVFLTQFSLQKSPTSPVADLHDSTTHSTSKVALVAAPAKDPSVPATAALDTPDGMDEIMGRGGELLPAGAVVNSSVVITVTDKKQSIRNRNEALLFTQPTKIA